MGVGCNIAPNFACNGRKLARRKEEVCNVAEPWAWPWRRALGWTRCRLRKGLLLRGTRLRATPPFLSPRVGVHSQAPLPRALSTASPVTQAVRPALLPQRATFCRAVSQPAPQPYSQAALNVMFPTRDQDKQPSRPTGSWWPVRWRFPSKKQVVLAGVMTCALLLASYLLAVAGSIAPLSTVAAEGSLLAGAVNTFSSSAGSGAGGAFLPVAAMIFLQPQDRFFQDRARN